MRDLLNRLFGKGNSDVEKVPANRYYAILAIDKGGVYADTPPDALKKYLDDAANKLQNSPLKDFHVDAFDGVQCVPVFTTEQAVTAFNNTYFNRRLKSEPNLKIVAVPVVHMNQTELGRRIVDAGYPAIINPGSTESRLVSIDELRNSPPGTKDTGATKQIVMLTARGFLPPTEPALPETLYALVANRDSFIDTDGMSRAQLAEFFKTQDDWSMNTEATKLYGANTNVGPGILAFTELSAAKAFIDTIFRAHIDDGKEMLVILGVVGLSRSALYNRLRLAGDPPVILNPNGHGTRVLAPAEVEKLNDGSVPEIRERSIVWGSREGSLADQVR